MLRPGIEPDPHLPGVPHEAKTQQAPHRGRCNAALGLVHPEEEPLLHECRDSFEDASRRPFARHVDPEVVSVADERVAPPLQLRVKVVEHDVREQG
jgi:hypothetical protein